MLSRIWKKVMGEISRRSKTPVVGLPSYTRLINDEAARGFSRSQREFLEDKIMIVRHSGYTHELVNTFDYDQQSRLRTGLLRCGNTFRVPHGKILLAKVPAVDCPNCVSYRSARLN